MINFKTFPCADLWLSWLYETWLVECFKTFCNADLKSFHQKINAACGTVGMVPICPVPTESLWSYFSENVLRCSMELCRQMHGFTLVVVRVVQTTNLEGITHGFLPWKDAMCKRVVSSRPTLPGLLQLNLHCAWINDDDGLNWAASNKTSHAFCLPVLQ